GNAVSLVERQLKALRDENRQLQRKLGSLIETAKSNEELNQRIQNFVISLISAGNSLDDFLPILYEKTAEVFNTDAVTLRVFESTLANNINKPEFVDYDAQVFDLFENVLGADLPICGRLTDAQSEYLFPEIKIGSAVLIPIGLPRSNGIYAMGSNDVARFNAGMATDLLQYLGDTVSHLLYRYTG
ncbi:MAG: DUF484 family protein, partial [Pseudomonadota bacterium]